MMENMGYEQETLKDIVEKEADEEQEEDIDLTPHEHERALKGAYRSFLIPGVLKTDTDSYFDQTKGHIKTLIKTQLKEIESAKIIMTLWVIWKNPIMPLIELDSKDAKNAQDLDDGSTGDNYIRIEVPFNTLMTESFDASNINGLMQCMVPYIKAQTENPKFPESDFTLDTMHLYINLHRLVLTRGSSYNELPQWLKSKKTVINPQSKDDECFKWAVIGAFHHEDIKHHPDRISLLRSYEKHYNWKGLNFPVSIKKNDKFEKNNPGISVNVLFSNEQYIYVWCQKKHLHCIIS